MSDLFTLHSTLVALSAFLLAVLFVQWFHASFTLGRVYYPYTITRERWTIALFFWGICDGTAGLVIVALYPQVDADYPGVFLAFVLSLAMLVGARIPYRQYDAAIHAIDMWHLQRDMEDERMRWEYDERSSLVGLYAQPSYATF